MTAALTVGQVMLKEIIDHPHDKTLRRIYADYIEENGGKQERHLAELIRLGGVVRLCTYAHSDRVDWTFPHDNFFYPGQDDYRLFSIARTHLRTTDISTKVVNAVEYRHGFIEVIGAPLEVLVKHLPKWVTEYPLTEVEVSDLEPWDENEGDPYGKNQFGWWERVMIPSGVKDESDIKDILDRGSGPKVFQAMWDSAEGYEHSDDVGRWLLFDTKEEAIKLLSDTLLDMARKGTL